MGTDLILLIYLFNYGFFAIYLDLLVIFFYELVFYIESFLGFYIYFLLVDFGVYLW